MNCYERFVRMLCLSLVGINYTMQKILLLLILVAFSCSTHQYSFDNLLNRNTFDKKEIKDIQKLTMYFESRMGINQKDLVHDYNILIFETSFYFDSILNNLIFKDDLRSQLNDIALTTRNEIWTLSEATAYKSYYRKKFPKPIKYKSFGINPLGEYVELLKEISKKDTSIQPYIDEIALTGSLPSIYAIKDIAKSKQECQGANFESDYWRMVIAIHFITLIEDAYRHKELSE